MMFSINEEKKMFSLENDRLNLVCCYENGLHTVFFNNALASFNTNKNLSFFTLHTENKTLESKDFEVTAIKSGKDYTSELITLLLFNKETGICLRLHFLSDQKDTVEIIFQFKENLKEKPQGKVSFHSPFLADLSINSDEKVYYPAAPQKNARGESAIKFCEESFVASDMKLPFVVSQGDDTLGFAVSFPFTSDLIDCGSSQNRNVYFTTIKNRDELKGNCVDLALNDCFCDSVVFKITGLKNGWVEAFERTRKDFLSNYDLTVYKTKEAKLFKKNVVNNFTFLYGDCFNKKTLKIDTQKIINEGKSYGGYDTVTLWNGYPRLGIDSRSQWDFYDDFPGGRSAIKKAIGELHGANIKVFLPFIPWDRKADESDFSMADSLCKLLLDTDADGIQLDTLDSLPTVFVKKLNSLKKKIVLTSQLHPQKGRQLENITTSWDEFFYPINMQKINLSRFLMPSHITPAVSRLARREEKDELIKYAVFNAQPILVWEDVFGRVLPFSKEQKKEIAAYKKIYLENINVFCGKNPIPLYPTENRNIFCNLFVSDNNKEFIYALFNESNNQFCGKVLNLFENLGQTAECLLGADSSHIKNGCLCADLAPKKVQLIKVSV